MIFWGLFVDCLWIVCGLFLQNQPFSLKTSLSHAGRQVFENNFAPARSAACGKPDFSGSRFPGPDSQKWFPKAPLVEHLVFFLPKGPAQGPNFIFFIFGPMAQGAQGPKFIYFWAHGLFGAQGPKIGLFYPLSLSLSLSLYIYIYIHIYIYIQTCRKCLF